MKDTVQKPSIKTLAINRTLLETVSEANKKLEQVHKSLVNYLDMKRTAFPRFFFLSNEELVEIFSQTKEPTAVQPHLRKLFENIGQLEFLPSGAINAMFSVEKERIQFHEVCTCFVYVIL